MNLKEFAKTNSSEFRFKAIHAIADTLVNLIDYTNDNASVQPVSFDNQSGVKVTLVIRDDDFFKISPVAQLGVTSGVAISRLLDDVYADKEINDKIFNEFHIVLGSPKHGTFSIGELDDENHTKVLRFEFILITSVTKKSSGKKSACGCNRDHNCSCHKREEPVRAFVIRGSSNNPLEDFFNFLAENSETRSGFSGVGKTTDDPFGIKLIHTNRFGNREDHAFFTVI